MKLLVEIDVDVIDRDKFDVDEENGLWDRWWFIWYEYIW